MEKPLIYNQFSINLVAGQIYDLDFFPFVMQEVEVFNLGANVLQAMINDMSLPSGITILVNGDRTFRADHPAFKRVSFYSVAGTNILVVVSR